MFVTVADGLLHGGWWILLFFDVQVCEVRSGEWRDAKRLLNIMSKRRFDGMNGKKQMAKGLWNAFHVAF